MEIEERLPPACAFAISVLEEQELDPDAVPEEAVEAAQQHLTTCVRCLSSPPLITPPRKKKKVRRPLESDFAPIQIDEVISQPQSVSQPQTQAETQRVTITLDRTQPRAGTMVEQAPEPSPQPTQPKAMPQPPVEEESNLPALVESGDEPIDCALCRQLLPEYAEMMEGGKKVAELYPEVYNHLLLCDTGCLVLLDIFRQEAKANRKYRRKAVRDPFSAIGWELSGFFRLGHVPMSPMALSYGTLLLLLLFASLSALLAIRWDDARYYRPPVVQHTIPTPDGIGISDGLSAYDACNTTSYQDKRAAAQAMRQNQLGKASTLLTQATAVVSTDTTGCNGAEAAIYREDLQIRQSGHPFGVLVVSFDSGPGDASPTGGTDRHILSAAYTQELVGAYIAQHQYNSTRMSTAGAPLLYMVLANTTGEVQGALQVANTIASLAHQPDLSTLGLLAHGRAPLLGVLGLAPSNLLQVALPVLCLAGEPVISPTATGLFIIDQLTNTSMYQHCAPGFAFVRFSADDSKQSSAAADYAYSLGARKVAVFYDPSNPSSEASAQYFLSDFGHKRRTHIVAQETAVSDGLSASNGEPGASTSVLLDGLRDALKAHPSLIFAPMLTNDVITLAQAIAKLPARQQPMLMIGGEFVHPAALQTLVQWTRQQQFALPRIYVSVISAARPPSGSWQKQFYASFCQSFATPGSFCSGTAALDQGALLFADGVEMVGQALGSSSSTASVPTAPQLILKMSKENFAGVSSQIALHFWDKVLITSIKAQPLILSIQGDGSFQIVGH